MKSTSRVAKWRVAWVGLVLSRPRFLCVTLLVTSSVFAAAMGAASFAGAPRAAAAAEAPERQAKAEPQEIVVHLSHFTDDLHRAFMAVKLAGLMQKSGASVSLFLDIEGVRLADKRRSLDMTWGPSKTPLGQYYDAFVAAGGKVVLCPHCAHACGVDDAALARGASILSEDQLAAMLLGAKKILDY